MCDCIVRQELDLASFMIIRVCLSDREKSSGRQSRRRQDSGGFLYEVRWLDI